MKSIAELRLVANQKRTDFFSDIAEVKPLLRPDYILDKALHAADPDLSVLKRMEYRAKNNPLALLAAFGGIYVLVQQLMTKPAVQSPKTPKRGRRSRIAHSTSKGDYHGHIDSAERN